MKTVPYLQINGQKYWFVWSSTTSFEVNDMVTTDESLTGVIQYLDDKMAGIRLVGDSVGQGDTDGTLDGVQHFKCPPQHGIFVSLDHIKKRDLKDVTEQAQLDRDLESQGIYNICSVKLQDEDQEPPQRDIELQGICYDIAQKKPQQELLAGDEPEQQEIFEEVLKNKSNIKLILDFTMDETLTATGRKSKHRIVPKDEIMSTETETDPESECESESREGRTRFEPVESDQQREIPEFNQQEEDSSSETKLDEREEESGKKVKAFELNPCAKEFNPPALSSIESSETLVATGNSSKDQNTPRDERCDELCDISEQIEEAAEFESEKQRGIPESNSPEKEVLIDQSLAVESREVMQPKSDCEHQEPSQEEGLVESEALQEGGEGDPHREPDCVSVQMENEDPIFQDSFKDEVSSWMKNSTELLSENGRLRQKNATTDTCSEDQDGKGILSDLQASPGSGDETEVSFLDQGHSSEEALKAQIEMKKDDHDPTDPDFHEKLEQELSRSMMNSMELSSEVHKLREENAQLQKKQEITETLRARIASLEQTLHATKERKQKGAVKEMAAKLAQAKGKASVNKENFQKSVISRLIESNTPPSTPPRTPPAEAEHFIESPFEGLGHEESKSRNLLAHLNTKIDMEIKLANMQKVALKYKKGMEQVEKQMAKAKADQEAIRLQLEKEESKSMGLTTEQKMKDKEKERLCIILEERTKDTNAIKATMLELKKDAINYKGSSEKLEKELAVLKKDKEEKGQKIEQLLIQVDEKNKTENVLKTMLEECQEKNFQYKNLINAAEKDLSIAKKDQEEKSQAIEQLHIDLEERKKNLEIVEARLKASQKEAFEFEDSYEETQANLNESKEENVILRSKVGKQAGSIQKLEADLEDAINEKINYKKSLEEMESQLVEVMTGNVKKDRESDELRTQLEEQKHKRDCVESKLADAQDEALEYKSLSEQLKRKLKNLEKEEEEAQQKTNQLCIELEQQKKTINDLKVRLVDLQDIFSECKGSKEQTEASLSKLREDNVQMQAQLNEKNQTLRLTENQLADTKKEALDWKSGNEQAESELAKLKAEFEKNEQDSNNLRIQLEDQNEAMSQLKTEFFNAENEAAKYKTSSEQMEAKWTLFKEEQEEKDQKIAQLCIELNDQKRAVTDLNAKLEDSRQNVLQYKERLAMVKLAKMNEQSPTDQENKIEQLYTELENQTTIARDMTRKLKEATDEALKYKTRYEEAESKTGELETRNLDKEGQLLDELEAQKTVVSDMAAKLKEATDEALKYRTCFEEAQSKSSESGTRDLAVACHIEDLKMGMNEMKTKLKKATEEALKYKACYEEAERKIVGSETSGRAVEGHLEHRLRELEQISKKAEELEVALHESQSGRKQMEEHTEKLENRLREVEQISKKAEELEVALHESQSGRKKMEEHAEELEKSLMKFEEDERILVENLKKSLNTSNERNTKLQRQIDFVIPEFQSKLEKRMAELERGYEKKLKEMELERSTFDMQTNIKREQMQEKCNKKVEELERSLKDYQDKNNELAQSVSKYKSYHDEYGQLESQMVRMQVEHQQKINKLEKSISEYRERDYQVKEKVNKLEKSISEYREKDYQVKKREWALSEEETNQRETLRRTKALERELTKAKAQVLFWYQKSNPRARYASGRTELEEEQYIYEYNYE